MHRVRVSGHQGTSGMHARVADCRDFSLDGKTNPDACFDIIAHSSQSVVKHGCCLSGAISPPLQAG